VGGELARTLLDARQPVRAIVRDVDKAQEWAVLGCEIAVAHMHDASALAAAFEGAEGVFILPPPEFDPAPQFPEARAVVDAVATALQRARPGKVVCLSTIGVQAVQTNLLSQRALLEKALSTLPIPMTFLRPAWFMENFAWDVATARDEGVLASFLQPLDKAVPMIATADVGRVAAALIQQTWRGCRIVELEAEHRISPNEVAAAFTKVLGRPVEAQVVPRETWSDLFKLQGMKNPQPRMRMLDGFNEGWIAFEGKSSDTVKGKTRLETVLHGLVARTI
jgi:uncharacterized protein YbjT (DUF2867 family)